jgi:antitoxin (DNA-binding transcriptional repressor) of toxin-antitoxin stability system
MVQRGEHLNVTSKGTPLATLTPPIDQHQYARTQLEKLARTAIIHDVLSPVEERWDAMK